MKKVTLKTVNKKKLELKKTAIANLQMSDRELRVLVGGDAEANTSKAEIVETNCTHRPTLPLETGTTL